MGDAIDAAIDAVERTAIIDITTVPPDVGPHVHEWEPGYVLERLAGPDDARVWWCLPCGDTAPWQAEPPDA